MELLDLPPEILLKVVNEVKHIDKETGEQNVHALRLTCKPLSNIAVLVIFRNVALPKNADSLRRATDILCLEHVGRNIRELKVHAESIAPRDHLKKADKSHALVAHLKREAGGMEICVPLWTSSLSCQILRLLLVCKSGLASLKLEGWIKEESSMPDTLTLPSTVFCGVLEEGFFNAIVECLRSVQLPALRKLGFRIDNIALAQRFWEVYYSSSRNNFAGNMSSLGELCLNTNRRRPLHKETSLEKFLGMASHLTLRSIKLALYDFQGPDIVTKAVSISSLGHNTRLTKLTLCAARITDNLSRVIEKLLSLEILNLDTVYINKDLDRWDSIFGVLLHLENLISVVLASLFYHDVRMECSNVDDFYSTFCSPFSQDFRAVRRLREHMKDRYRPGMNSFIWDWETCLVCDPDGP